ncbi:MAG: carboxypeptidase-like regulatory domain-containing protein [Candidatus Sulfotelmatobacter sp.]
MALQSRSGLIVFALLALGWASLCLGQTPQQTPVPDPEQQGTASPGGQLPAQQSPGSVGGTVVDQSGAVVGGAQVTLTAGGQSRQEAVSGDDGQFSFVNVAPGPFQLTITAAGFASQTSSGILRAGEIHTVAQIVLSVATNVNQVQVILSPTDVAEGQVKDEEKQRVLGVIPNFYVTYDPHPVALTPKQKFELAWKTTVDPVTFAIVGGIAGVQQAEDAFSGYGQGAQGYAKRYGAGYADLAAGTFIGSALLPSLLKQDPRYFYKGTGSKRSRILYAFANSVICKGDNGHWQTNYSNIVGSLAAGAISNLYYPAQNRGAALIFENAAIGVGATAAANLVEEFLMRKLTPNIPKGDSTKP